MRCKKYSGLLALYVGGDLSPKHKGRLENHLSGCSECRRELSLLQASQEVIKRAGNVDVPGLKWEEFWPPIREQVLGRHARFHARGELRVIKRKFALAFAMPALALLAVIGLYLFANSGYFSRIGVVSTRRPVIPSPMAEGKAGRGEISVWMGSKYPIIDYVGSPDASVMVFNTKDPMMKIVWVFDDAFDLTLAR